MTKDMRQPDIEKLIRQMFDENFERLRAENGHSLSPDVKEAAWQQVLMYWKRLHEIAESITDTEVKLSLPDQATSNGKKFCIEGVVDIVRESDRTTMYDLKTHDLDFVKANKEFYQKQLNVYAHIWQNLRGERLDETAVICTPLPNEVRKALENGNDEELASTLSQWDPVVSIPFAPQNVQKTIEEFGKVVDAIEDNQFSAPPVEKLQKRDFSSQTFGTRVCRNCDARFSCSAYRKYAKAPQRKDVLNFSLFYSAIETEIDQQAWIDATVPNSESALDLPDDV